MTEKIGVHALFGAFLVGVALSSSSSFTEKAREAIASPTLDFFAPIFFATVGLKVNFLQSFNWIIVLVLLVVAYIGKIVAAMMGGKLTHIPARESLAIGLGIAARGGMGVILAIVAYDTKIINDSIFTGLIIMAVITSMTAGFIRNLLPSSNYPEDGNFSVT
jgi:Kef-type K+ transport system membrane component KefB